VAKTRAIRPPRPTAPAWRSFITPEGVDLRLQIGTAGERAAAFLLDAAIITGVLIALTLLCFLAAMGTRFEAAELMGVVWLLGFFLLRNLYFTLFELRPGAATPGKRALGLRVAARNGGRLGAEAVFARNAMRELEVFLPLSFLVSSAGDVDGWISLLGLVWCGVFVFFPAFNRDKLRVGDLVAGTWVVRAPRRKLTRDMAEAGVAALPEFGFTTPQLDAYGVKELHVLEEVLRRRDAKTMRAVADRVRRKIDWAGAEPDHDFLTAYYAGLRGRLEQRLLFGKRKADKFDVG
jgi:uncharacterized RDD family membrane protein YckC